MKYFCRTKILIVLSISFFSLFYACNEDSNPVESEDNSPKYNSEMIDQAYEKIANVNGIRSLVISQNSSIIGEQYYNNTGPEPDSILDVRSVTKSILSTLVGIALDKGYLESLDQKVSEFISPLVDSLSKEMGDISIRELITMTAGFEWHEIAEESEFPEFATAPDQLLYILEKPFVNEPGTVFDYSDGAAHLTSIILSEATGMSASAFANQYLLNPMGIGDRFWYEDNRSYNFGGVGLCIGPKDMIKIGELYLNEGSYNGNIIVSSGWINQATSAHISTNNVLPYLTDYGYYWWKGNQNGHDFSIANGYGGQFICIVPDLNVVVVATCNFLGMGAQAGQNWSSILGIIMSEIIPAFN